MRKQKNADDVYREYRCDAQINLAGILSQALVAFKGMDPMKLGKLVEKYFCGFIWELSELLSESLPVEIPPMDETAVRAFWKYLNSTGQGVYEMAVFPEGGKPVICLVANEEAVVAFSREWHGKANVYISVNSRPERFFASSRRAAEKDIEEVNRFLIDLEVKHKEDLPMEKVQPAIDRGICLREWFVSKGFSSPIMNFSGNGVHLVPTLLPIKATTENKCRVKQFYCELSRVVGKYNTPETEVIVDKTFDYVRLMKLPGTLSCKSKVSTNHRLSRIDKRLLESPQVEPDAVLTEYILSLGPEEEFEYSKEANKKEASQKTAKDIQLFLNEHPELRVYYERNPLSADGGEDRSGGDFRFICRCLAIGDISDKELADYLRMRPVGKARSLSSGGQKYILNTIEAARREATTDCK